MATIVAVLSEVTRILSALSRDEASDTDRLLALVYDELRRLAERQLSDEKPGQTLQATALVHEAYLRLVDTEDPNVWNSRGHFFCAAAEAMRRILIDRARRKLRPKHGGDRLRVDLESAFPATEATPEALLAIDDALVRLEQRHPEKAQIVKLRHYAGCTLQQAAAAMGVSSATAKRYWAYARAQLFSELMPED